MKADLRCALKGAVWVLSLQSIATRAAHGKPVPEMTAYTGHSAQHRLSAFASRFAVIRCATRTLPTMS